MQILLSLGLVPITISSPLYESSTLRPTVTCRRKDFGQISGRVVRFDHPHVRNICKQCDRHTLFDMSNQMHECEECGQLAPDGVEAVYNVTGVHLCFEEGYAPIRIVLTSSAVPAAVGHDASWAMEHALHLVQGAADGHSGSMARVSVECCDGIFWGRDFAYVEVEAAA